MVEATREVLRTSSAMRLDHRLSTITFHVHVSGNSSPQRKTHQDLTGGVTTQPLFSGSNRRDPACPSSALLFVVKLVTLSAARPRRSDLGPRQRRTSVAPGAQALPGVGRGSRSGAGGRSRESARTSELDRPVRWKGGHEGKREGGGVEF